MSSDPRVRSLLDEQELHSIQLSFDTLLDLLIELNGSEDDEATRRLAAQCFAAGRNAAHAESASPRQREKGGAFRSGLAPRRPT